MKQRLPRLWSSEFFRQVAPEMQTMAFHKAEPGYVSPWFNNRILDFDIWYVAAGSGEVRFDDRWLGFGAGDIVLLKPGSVFQRERASNRDPFQVYCTHVLPFGRADRGLNGILANNWPARMSLLHRPEVRDIVDRMFEAHATGMRVHTLTIQGLMLQYLDVIFQELRRTPPARQPRACLKLVKARDLIETQYRHELKLSDIAAHSDLSPSHLSALFTHYFGHPPIEHLVRVRLREAKLLLAKGMRVKEAAYAVGFQSQHYFARAFKKRDGRTPTQFAARFGRL